MCVCVRVSDKPGQVIKFIQIYVSIYNINSIYSMLSTVPTAKALG